MHPLREFEEDQKQTESCPESIAAIRLAACGTSRLRNKVHYPNVSQGSDGGNVIKEVGLATQYLGQKGPSKAGFGRIHDHNSFNYNSLRRSDPTRSRSQQGKTALDLVGNLMRCECRGLSRGLS